VSPPAKVRVLVVNGDTLLRQGLSRTLGQHPGIEVVGWAISGRTAAPKVLTYRPDVLVIDLEHNAAEGLELAAQQVPHAGPRSVLIAAEHAGPGPGLGHHGVAEVLRRPAGLTGEALVERLAQDLVAPLLRHGRNGSTADWLAGAATPLALPVSAPTPPAMPGPAAAAGVTAPPPAAWRGPAPGKSPLVVGIGVSTGGPKTLAQLLPLLPADFPLPIALVQHMPPRFTQSLAESLDKVCKLRVAEARDSDRVERGRILIAPGGQHMRLVQTELGLMVRLTSDPPVCSCRPSVDYLFRSLVDTCGGRVLGVVLTGMGEDGWVGSKLIHAAGGKVLAQDEASSTVFGMPRGPIEAGIAPAVPLLQMAEAMQQLARGASCN
jgi:two-component system chemotaxis response regulator CheB